MLFEQTHFPLGGGPNWKKIGVIVFILLAIAGGAMYWWIHLQNEHQKKNQDKADLNKPDSEPKPE